MVCERRDSPAAGSTASPRMDADAMTHKPKAGEPEVLLSDEEATLDILN